MSFGPELIWLTARKFRGTLVGRYVQRIEGGSSYIVLSLSGSVVLLLSWRSVSCGVTLMTEREKKTLLSSEKQMPPITNALKSHILNAKIASIEQTDRDKILKFTFNKTIGAGFINLRCLTFEIMERYGNLVLTDADDIIIEAAKHIHPSENRYRSVLPGQRYVKPPAYKGTTLESWLANPDAMSVRDLVGFGRPLLNMLSEMPLDQAVGILKHFYNATAADFIPLRIDGYFTSLPEAVDRGHVFPSLNAMWKEMVLKVSLSRSTETRKKKIRGVIAKEIKRRERQLDDIKALMRDNADIYKHYGELIVSNLSKIRPGEKEAILPEWDSSGERRYARVPLDPAKSAAKNADLWFAKYKKITAAQKRAAKLPSVITTEINDLREQDYILASLNDTEALSQIEAELRIADPKKQKKRCGGNAEGLPPHKRFDLGFALVFLGLSAAGNRYVTFKLANADDIWFHIHGGPGAHVMLRYFSHPAPEEEKTAKEFCASLAARYSRAGSVGARVDYTRRKYVSPIRGGVANVTYREFSSVWGDPAFCYDYLKSASHEENLKPL